MLCKVCNVNELSAAKLRKKDYKCYPCEYLAHKDVIAAGSKRARDKKRERVFNHYGNECAFCHATEDLHIDHMNGDGNGLTGSNLYRQIIINDFPDTYQTLCRQCNIAKQQMTN